MPVPGAAYPVNLHLAGQRCLVVGGGPVAARKIEGLLTAGADVYVVAIRAGDEVRALGVPVHERPYEAQDLTGCCLAISATGDPAVDSSVYRDGTSAGVLVNSADDPAHCHFTLPAVARRGDLQITVSSGGRSPAMASWLRDELAGQIGPAHLELLEILAAEREALRSRGIGTENLDWRGALESGMLEDIGNGRVEAAKERLRACLSSSSD